MITSKGIRWSEATISNGRQRLITQHCHARLYSVRSSPLSLSSSPSLRKKPSRSGIPQCRSISIWPSSWGASKGTDFTKAHTPTDSTGPSAVGYDAQLHAQQASSSQSIQAANQSPDYAASLSNEATTIAPEPAIATQPTSSFLPDAVEPGQLLHSIPERLGYLREVCGLDFGWGPSTSMEWLLEHIHITGGFSWATSIVILAAATRISFFYLGMKASDMGARLRSAQHHVKPLQERMKEASKNQDQAGLASAKAELFAVKNEYGIKYSRMFLPIFVMIPIQFGSFRVLRNMADLPVPALETENWLWTNNLALGDPYMVLPFINAAMTYLTLKRGGEMGGAGVQTGIQKIAVYAIPVFSWLILNFNPGTVQLYFLVTGFFALVQSRLLTTPACRRYLGLHPTPPPADATTLTPSIASKPKSLGSGNSSLSIYQPPSPPAKSSSTSTKAPTNPDDNHTIIDRFADYTKSQGSKAVEDVYKSFGTSQEKRAKENRTKMHLDEAEKYEKSRAAEIERERADANYWVGEEEREKEEKRGKAKREAQVKEREREVEKKRARKEIERKMGKTRGVKRGD